MYTKLSISLLAILLFSSCGKNYLDLKPDNRKFVYETLEEFQTILDNITTCHFTVSLGEVGADNYYIKPEILAQTDFQYVSRYLWVANGWTEDNVADWRETNKAIFVANLTLEGLEKIARSNSNMQDWDLIKGTAHYLRGMHYFHLASIFSDIYTEKNSLGIPLRLEIDASINPPRGKVQDVYRQIIMDMEAAITFLPEVNRSEHKFRPSKHAAYGLMARIYLAMEEYAKAAAYATKFLNLGKPMIDFNTLSKIPAVKENNEIVYYSQMQANPLIQSRIDIDPDLYRSYASNDLRAKRFFKAEGGRVMWMGSFTGEVKNQFSGITTAEIYLIRAECLAREGNVTAAMNDLNALMVNRYAAFTPFTAGDGDQALRTILSERRKELLFRGVRWTDLRRLNKDARFAVTITRYYDGKEYKLVPGDKKYLFPLPKNEINVSGIEQNPR